MGLFDITHAIAGFEWDMETLKSLHLNLSKNMNHEVEALLSLSGKEGESHEHHQESRR